MHHKVQQKTVFLIHQKINKYIYIYPTSVLIWVHPNDTCLWIKHDDVRTTKLPLYFNSQNIMQTNKLYFVQWLSMLHNLLFYFISQNCLRFQLSMLSHSRSKISCGYGPSKKQKVIKHTHLWPCIHRNNVITSGSNMILKQTKNIPFYLDSQKYYKTNCSKRMLFLDQIRYGKKLTPFHSTLIHENTMKTNCYKEEIFD